MSTRPLNALLRVHVEPLNPVIFRESYPVMLVRHFILTSASRLDAFSGYPIQT